jgi:hypothetical protein
MLVRALMAFGSESGLHAAGDVWEMADSLAVLRIEAGLVAPSRKAPEKATAPEPEVAVKHHDSGSHRGRR